MQEFLDNGNLNPGIHNYTLTEFKRQFVSGFTTSASRNIIYSEFQEWLNGLLEILIPRCIWIDGSYLTKKINPHDIDLVIYYGPEDIASADIADKLGRYISVESRRHSCDAYFCYTFKHLSPEQLAIISASGTNTIMETYWMGQFTFDRQRRPKGLIEINRDELLIAKGGVSDDITTGTDK